MEMLVIAIVALVAFAAVLLPLLRRGRGSVAEDEREFGAGAARQDAAIASPDDDARPPHVPASDAHVHDTSEGVAATASTSPNGGVARNDERIEREVLRYREAMRAGTLCARCGRANPPGSVYCADCGKRLPLADAQEFA